MKKRTTRLAAAAVLACAGAAHAQSSVTLWGIVDLNLQHLQATGTGSVNGMGNGSLSTSQLGFRGVEDLGGGLRAALARPEVRDQLVAQGFASYGMAPSEFAAFFRRQYDAFVATVRENNVRFD